MSHPSIEPFVVPDPPLLQVGESVESAVRTLSASALPALPVIDERRHLAGIFGEREFIQALFPGYLGELRHTVAVPRSLDEALERRQACRGETVARHMSRERVRIGRDGAQTQIAEIFLHSDAPIIPVVSGEVVEGLITRQAFVAAAAERFLAGT